MALTRNLLSSKQMLGKQAAQTVLVQGISEWTRKTLDIPAVKLSCDSVILLCNIIANEHFKNLHSICFFPSCFILRKGIENKAELKIGRKISLQKKK